MFACTQSQDEAHSQPQAPRLLLIAYPDVFAAGDQSPHINELGPIAVEGFQGRVIDNERLNDKHLPGLAGRQIVADGFSSRQQIAHGTRRRAMHTAEVLQMALHASGAESHTRRYIESGHTEPDAGYPLLAVIAGVAMLSAGLLCLLTRRSEIRRSPASHCRTATKER